ncbi:GNAT family N-acetyltransferase [Candidatus Neptunochlamydia vexilliferae]|uniref:GNAT family N-acetyltransferase n=1 Tax=Candidatus Neptunichlamydia vexilliferae TaxID=1651774 RepID=UPI001891B6E6|nr:GNAT family protein [Candidatus Neptunochlamydia vexilliferae]
MTPILAPNLLIRPTQKKDRTELFQWLDDEETLKWFPLAKTKEEIGKAVDYWVGYIKEGSSLTIEKEGICCGIATLFTDPYTKTAHHSELGIIIGKKWRNQGLGTQLLHALFSLARDQFKMEFLHLLVYDESPALSLYKRLGFKEFGRQQRWIKEASGDYRACIFMEKELSTDQVLFVGPTLGSQGEPVIYSLDSDESSAITPEEALSEEAKASDREYAQNNTAFTLAAAATANKEDHVILDTAFQQAPSLLEWQFSIHEKLGLEVTKNIHFAPSKSFAPLAKELAKKTGISTISTIGYSFLLNETFSIEEELTISKKVNAKTSLLELSKLYEFPISPSKLLSFDDLTSEALESLGFPNQPVYLKANGLGGGYNVKRIATAKELDAFIRSNHDTKPQVLAQRGVPSSFVETEHIFIVYPERVEYLYPSIQLTAGSSWYGNLFKKTAELTSKEEKALLAATRALQKEGYAKEKGTLVGFDSLSNGSEIYILEFNARWLGSLPVARLLDHLGLLNKEEVFSSFDYIHEEDLKKYQEFGENHLYGTSNTSGFAFIPLSFSPYSTDSKRVVYYVVTGDIVAFAKKVKEEFGERSFEMLDGSMDQLRNFL